MTRTAAAAGAIAFLLVSVSAVVLGVGRLVERVFDLPLPTPLDPPPFVFWVVALVTGSLANWLGRIADPPPPVATGESSGASSGESSGESSGDSRGDGRRGG